MQQSHNQKEIILQFLRKNVLATISTVNNQTLKPESALVAYAQTDGCEIVFTTREGTRKYKNLMKNSHVALVIGWDLKNWITLQYEGEARVIRENEYSKYKKLFANKKGTPCTEEFLSNPRMKLFKITPTWIGYSDFTDNKPNVIEIKDF